MKKCEFKTSDVTDLLVGIKPAYLNKFIQLGFYGIRPSVQTGKVREQRRIFSEADVFGIALVWLLFEAGLRTEPIARILNQIGTTKKADANTAAQKILDVGADFVAVLRSPRGPKDTSEKPGQDCRLLRLADAAQLFQQLRSHVLLLVPVGQRFADIRQRLELLF